MEYAQLINSVAACMGNEARTFTRYNKAAVEGTGEEAGMKARDCKMVVVDYKGTDVNFNLRAGQMVFGKDITAKMAFDKIAGQDQTLRHYTSLETAAIECGLGSKYVPALRDILGVGRCFVNELEPGKIMFGSFVSDDGAPGVSIFVECKDMVVILTVKE